MAMQPTPDAGALPPRHGRRILIALLILLLILLPLYLWPLRGGLGALPWGSALSGPPKDPRNPSAVAVIPGDVWDALMGGASQAPPGPPKPRNLTMIAELEPRTWSGVVDADAGGPPFSGPPGGSPPQSWLAGLVDQTDYKASDADSSSSTPTGSGQGNPSGWLGIPGFGDTPRGLFGGGGPGPSRAVFSPPSNDPAPQPTPEPTTIVLVGVNVALLSAAAWKRRRRVQEITPIG